MCKWLHSILLEIAVKQSMASQQLPGDSKTIDISIEKCANCFATASWRFQTMNPPTPQELERVGPQTKHRIRRLLRARACQTPDKASKPASNLSEPTCKAATRVEVSPAKPKPTTSPKPKPARPAKPQPSLTGRTGTRAKVSIGHPSRATQPGTGRKSFWPASFSTS